MLINSHTAHKHGHNLTWIKLNCAFKQQSTQSSVLNLIVAFQFVAVGNKLSANVPGILEGGTESQQSTHNLTSQYKEKGSKANLGLNYFGDMDLIIRPFCRCSPKPFLTDRDNKFSIQVLE